jgi:hypothetical protein
VQDLSYLLPMLENQISEKFKNLNKAVIELIEDFNLVGFESLCVEVRERTSPRCAIRCRIAKGIVFFSFFFFGGWTIQDKASMTGLIQTIDKALGYYPSHQPRLADERGDDGREPELSIPRDAARGPPTDIMAMEAELSASSGLLTEIQERWIDYPELYDQFQRQLWAEEADLVHQKASELNQINAIKQNQQNQQP